MADWHDILNDDEEQLSQEELMKYLDPSLSEAEKHAIEKKLVNAQFEEEALEGLENFDNSSKLNDYVHQLNKNLQQQLSQKKQRKEKRKIKDISWIIITAVIILAICVLAYVMIHLHRKNQKEKIIAPVSIVQTKGF